MLDLAVIADDLTGAADTGIQFRPEFEPVYLVDHRFRSMGSFRKPPRALSIFTASRGLPAADAHRVVFDVCQVLSRHAPRRVFKKIDSALRGNIGAEVEAVMDALGVNLSFIAPAFIEQGRTTVKGVHCIHGRPVAQTEMRRDPVTPVCESSLPDWIGRQAHLPIAHVDLRVLDQGPDAVAGVIDAAVNRGVRHFTFDAAAVEHLEGIARLALNRYPQALLCGSAGLAQGMARALAVGRAPRPAASHRLNSPQPGHWLYVCGSASEQLRQQVRELAAQGNVHAEALDPACLVSDRISGCRAAAVQRAAERLAAGDLVMAIAPSSDPLFIEPAALLRGFADIAGSAIEAARPAGLFLSGGDTALAVLERLRVRAVRLERELDVGLVLGILIGGLMEGVPVVTKAGAFGPPDVLLKLKAAVSGDGRIFGA